MADEPEESYEANTVEELREELRARDLPTSGHKDELVARLEEDDAAAEGGKAKGSKAAPEQQAEEAPDYYPPITYSPYELPANTAAAQAFILANPDAVDESIILEPERLQLAVVNIQDHVDQMAEFGITVDDPRLYGDPQKAAPEEEKV